MANRIILLCLLVSCLTVSYIECWRSLSSGRSRSNSGSRIGRGSSSSWGKNWGSSSSGPKLSWSSSYSKPTSTFGSSSSAQSYPLASTGLSGSGSSPHRVPSSSSGSSGWNLSSLKEPLLSSGLSGKLSGSGYISPTNPAFSSGLSNEKFGSLKYPSAKIRSLTHTYPSSSSGISGSSSGSKYLSSFERLSGSISGSSKYPPLSGSSGFHSYPSSSKGISSLAPSNKPMASIRSHSYPSLSSFQKGLSGSQSHGTNNKRPIPKTSSYTNKSPHNFSSRNVLYTVPSYQSSPQYVYIKDYRHSNSRYGDLLTGLTLYNLGRSHSHYHDHYYYDDYYRRRYDTSSSSSMPMNKPQDQATCILKVKENEKIEILKIPCEIVSTFNHGFNKKAPSAEKAQLNKTVCTTTTTMINNTVQVPMVQVPSVQVLAVQVFTVQVPAVQEPAVNGSSANSTVPSVTTNMTMVNVTVCITYSTAIDPLTVKGPQIDPKNLECVLEIHTKDAFLQKNIDCDTLLLYANINKPEKDINIPHQEVN